MFSNWGRRLGAAMVLASVVVGCGGSAKPAHRATPVAQQSTAPQTSTTPAPARKKSPAHKKTAHAQKAHHHAVAKAKPRNSAPLVVPTDLPSGGSTRDFAGLGSYGASAASSTRAQIIRAVMTYEVATEKGRWAVACSEIAPVLRSRLVKQFGSATRGKKPTCTKLLAALEGNTPKAEIQQTMPNHVVAVRAKGRQGFFLFSAPGVKHGSMPVVLVGSSWDVGALAGSSLQ